MHGGEQKQIGLAIAIAIAISMENEIDNLGEGLGSIKLCKVQRGEGPLEGGTCVGQGHVYDRGKSRVLTCEPHTKREMSEKWF